jgi:hypothetical protein
MKIEKQPPLILFVAGIKDTSIPTKEGGLVQIPNRHTERER